MFESNGIGFAYKPSSIFKRGGQWLYGREPVLRRMKDGSLGCLVYSGGEREPSPENVVLYARSYDDGQTWSKPELLFKHMSRAVWGTEIFTEGERHFAIIQTFDFGAFYSELRAHISYTGDSGKTWSEPETLKGTPPNFCVRQGRVLSNGDWLFPVYWMEGYGEFDWKLVDGRMQGKDGKAFDFRKTWLFRSGVIRSSNKGESFKLSGYLSPGAGLHAWEPDVIELEDGHLLMLVRCDGTDVLWRSESFDFGDTWSELAKTEIPNPGTKVVMYKIDGQIVMLNNVSEHGGWENRRRLEAWTSDDNCKSWGKKTLIAEVLPLHANAQTAAFPPGKVICYPHAFPDFEKRTLYAALDSVGEHHFIKIPFEDLLIKKA